jgi:hypothetical protein
MNDNKMISSKKGILLKLKLEINDDRENFFSFLK